MRIYFMTFGCKVNLYETAAMEGMFAERGYVLSDRPDDADICVINSCTVTSESDNKAGQALRRLRRLRPDAVIAVTGCYPQALPEAEKMLPEADIITGTKDRSRLPDLVEDFLDKRTRTVYIPEYGLRDEFEKMSCTAIPGHTRAFLKIQDGCDRFCSYCMIPYSRGRIRSKAPEDLRSEAEALAKAGYSELVLTGINLAFYGAELGMNLADAVEICNGIDGIKRIRLGSLEPEMMTDSVLDRLSACEKLCPSFHLSLQSGCAKTLKAMNRRYTPEEYFSLAEKLRARFADCSITTDVMTGFPGETEEDFIESYEFVKRMRFADIHVFPYSVRRGTRAEKMPCQIDGGTKHRRAEKMSALGREMRREFLESQLGRTYPVLFEREKNDGFHGGYAPNYTFIKILTKNSEKSLRNMVFYVTIDKIGDDCCFGHIEDGRDPDVSGISAENL